MLITFESDVSVLDGRRDSLSASHLSGPERERRDGMADSGRRDGFLLGRAMLRSVLASQLDCSAQDIELTIEERGRPVVADNNWRFSISHSDGHVLLALTGDAEEVGVDLERASGDREWRRLARRRLPADLAEVVEHSPPGCAAARFCTFWTLLEAVAKACGSSVLARENFALASELAHQGSGIAPASGSGWHWLHQVDADWHRSLVWKGRQEAPLWQRWQPD